MHFEHEAGLGAANTRAIHMGRRALVLEEFLLEGTQVLPSLQWHAVEGNRVDMGECGTPILSMDMGGFSMCNYWQGFGVGLGECSTPVNIGVIASLTRKRRTMVQNPIT